MTIIAGWENFYAIIGAASAVLIGLQFVVISLISLKRIKRIEANAASAFSTPSVFHFSAVLLLAAIAVAPWSGIAIPAILWGLIGIGGFVYVIIVARRIKAQKAYQTLLYDWMFHVVLPLLAYAVLAISAYATLTYPQALFFIAAAVLAIILIGIHNTWDAITYLVFVRFSA